MKQKETKILAVLMAIIVVIGIIMLFVKGLSFELRYRNTQKVEINIGKEFEISDIKEITGKIFRKQTVRIQYIEVYKDAVSITTDKITEEQKEELIAKLNEKYGAEIKYEDVEIENVGHTRVIDILKPYVVPFVIVTIIILVYLVIRYNKLNHFMVAMHSIQIIIISQIILLCIMAITRMPIGRFTIPIVLIVYILSTYICTTKFEEDLKNINLSENKK